MMLNANMLSNSHNTDIPETLQQLRLDIKNTQLSIRKKTKPVKFPHQVILYLVISFRSHGRSKRGMDTTILVKPQH